MNALYIKLAVDQNKIVNKIKIFPLNNLFIAIL